MGFNTTDNSIDGIRNRIRCAFFAAIGTTLTRFRCIFHGIPSPILDKIQDHDGTMRTEHHLGLQRRNHRLAS